MNKAVEQILKYAQSRNKNILTKKVHYGPKEDYIEGDQSNVWYKVIIAPENLNISKGDLVRFPPRFVVEEKFANEIFYNIDYDLVTLVISKQNVKTDFFQ